MQNRDVRLRFLSVTRKALKAIETSTLLFQFCQDLSVRLLFDQRSNNDHVLIPEWTKILSI